MHHYATPAEVDRCLRLSHVLQCQSKKLGCEPELTPHRHPDDQPAIPTTMSRPAPADGACYTRAIGTVSGAAVCTLSGGQHPLSPRCCC